MARAHSIDFRLTVVLSVFTAMFALTAEGARGADAPGDGRIVITDYTGRGFQPDLVQYALAPVPERLTRSLMGLRSAGASNLDRLYGYVAPDWRYYLNLLTPSHNEFDGASAAALAAGVVMKGSAAAVRVRPDAATLALVGGAGSAEYKGCAIEGIGPYEQTVALSQLNAAPVAIPSREFALASGWADLSAGDKASEIAPGVEKLTRGDERIFVVESGKSPSGVRATFDGISIDARRAIVRVGANKARFVVPDASYARLTAGEMGVRGKGPFDITITPQDITGKVDGQMRTLVVTRPRKLVRPMYHLDGVRWYAAFPDEFEQGLVRPGQLSFDFAMAVTDGPHEVRVSEWTYPELPPTPARATVTAGR